MVRIMTRGTPHDWPKEKTLYTIQPPVKFHFRIRYTDDNIIINNKT